MHLISSLSWVKQGHAREIPDRVALNADEIRKFFLESTRNEENKLTVKSTEDIEEKYDLKDYDSDSDGILPGLSTLAQFASNDEDPLLTVKNDGEDSDEEDFCIRADDNLLVASCTDGDFSELQVYVYNNAAQYLYVHHDVGLESIPICMDWLSRDPCSDAQGNFVAVGSYNSTIELWDLDVVGSLKPVVSFGKRRKRPKESKKLSTCHTDAVLSVSWNSQLTNVIASGGADNRLILWDLDTLSSMITLVNHTDKVQSVKFHSSEQSALLSGSSDRNVILYDCRDPSRNFKTWTLNESIDNVLWNHFEPNMFLVTTDNGMVHSFDCRTSKALAVLHSSTSGGSVEISLSSRIPGLLVTAGEDGTVRIWDTSGHIDFIAQRDLSIGSINCCAANPDHDFVFAFAGHSNEPVIWDIRENAEVRSRFMNRSKRVWREDTCAEADGAKDEDVSLCCDVASEDHFDDEQNIKLTEKKRKRDKSCSNKNEEDGALVEMSKTKIKKERRRKKSRHNTASLQGSEEMTCSKRTPFHEDDSEPTQKKEIRCMRNESNIKSFEIVTGVSDKQPAKAKCTAVSTNRMKTSKIEIN